MINNDESLLFSCSGCADVGEIADRSSRLVSKENPSVKFFCLAGIAAGIPGIVDKTKKTPKRIVVDGCNLDCGKKIFQNAGLSDFISIRITDTGLVKGATPVDEKNISDIALLIKTKI